MPTYWDLTIFGDDGQPVLGSVDGTGAITEASFSTDPAHPRPFLQRPSDIAAQEADFQKGRASTSQVNFTVADVPLDPLDQATGVWTSILTDLATGASRIKARRAVMQQRTAGARTLVLDGFLGGSKLHDSRAGFNGYIRDTSERVRKIRAFQYTNTTSVFPRGATNGYGRLSGGGWMIPPTTPRTGTFERFSGSGVDGGRVVFRDRSDAFTSAMKQAGTPQWLASAGARVLRYALVRWRLSSGGDWHVLANMQLPNRSFLLPAPDLPITNLFGPEDGKVKYIYMRATATTPVPRPGQQVQIQVDYSGPTTSNFPFHFEGTHGELLRNYYRGDYSYVQNEDGDWVPVPPQFWSVRFDEAALMLLSEPCRVRITAPVDDDGRKFPEAVYQSLGAVPQLDAQGRISPVRFHLPDASVELPVIATAAAAGFDDDTRDAVNRVKFTYQRDYFTDDPDQGGGDGVRTEDVTYQTPADISPIRESVALLGEQSWEVKATTLRALGGADGQPLAGDVIDEVAARLAAERAQQALDRLILGGKSVPGIEVFRDDLPDVRAGGWAIVQLPWIPGAATRGSNLLVQITKLWEKDSVTRKLDALSAGPAQSPLLPPTLSAPTAGDSAAEVRVAALPSGATHAAVEYAESDTLPAAESVLWRPAGRAAIGEAVATPPLAAGRGVWLRARSVAAGRRPSLYTAPVQVTLPPAARVLTCQLEVAPDTGAVALRWTVTTATLGMRLHYGAASPCDAPSPTAYVDVAAVAGLGTIPLAVQPGLQLTVDLEPWTGWTGAAVTGAAGDRVRRQATRAADDLAVRILSVERVAALGTATHDTWEYTCGPLVSQVWRAYQVVVGEASQEAWDAVGDVAELGGDVTEGTTGQVTVALPPLGSTGLLYLVPKVIADTTPPSLVTPTIPDAARKVTIPGPGSIAPSLEVTPSGGATSVTIAWSGDAVELSINAGVYAAPPPSPIVVARPAAGAAPLVYSFRATRDGATATDSVTIQSLDKDTVTPDLVVTPVTASTNNAQAAFTCGASRPDTGAAVAVSVRLSGCAGTNNGATLPVDTTQTVAGAIVVTRPAFGAGAGTVTFTASVAGGGSEVIQRTIEPVQRDTVGPSLYVTPGVQTATTMPISWVATTSSSTSAPLAVQVTVSGVSVSYASGSSATSLTGTLTATRPAAGTPAGTVNIRAGRDGLLQSDTVTIPPVGADTVTPDLTVTPVAGSTSNTQAAFTATATNPRTAAAVPVIVTLTGCTATVGGVAFTSGSALAAGLTLIVARPAFGSAAGTVTFTATVASAGEIYGGTETIQRTVPAVQQDTSWPVISYDSAENGTTATLWFKIVERGIAVSSAQVRTQVGAAGLSALAAPTRGPGGASVVKGGLLGAGEYEQDLALDPTRFSLIYGYNNLASGVTQSHGPYPFDRNKNPNLISVEVDGQSIRVQADAGDTLSLKAYRTDVAGWSTSVDGIFAVFTVPVPSGDTWPVRVVAYAAGVVDVTGATPKDERNTVVAGVSAPAGPAWSLASVAAPASLGSEDVTLTVQATSAPAGHTAKFYARINGGAYSDVTASLVPAAGAVPTTPTAYTWATGWPRTSPPGLTITVEMRAEILNGSGVMVASSDDLPERPVCTYTVT
ncbi:MAG TPA: hypothetical protein VFJ16_31225 [Longimicrobium sp.]|nr:hypothetical protein [Longimicrobium sp.]